MKSTLAIAMCLVLLGGNTRTRWYEEASRPMVIVQEVQAKEPEPEVVLIEIEPTIPEVLERIADCESGERNADGTAIAGSARHYRDDGEVVIGRLNKPELGVDVGKFQINEHFHKERAQKMGLDIYNEHDNETYALVLYKENGTRDWRSSQSCWKKE